MKCFRPAPPRRRERDKCYAEPKASKVAIPPDKPEDWPHVFAQHLNVGDLDAVMALYEPEARCVSRSGETLVIPPHSPAPMRGLGVATRGERKQIPSSLALSHIP